MQAHFLKKLQTKPNRPADDTHTRTHTHTHTDSHGSRDAAREYGGKLDAIESVENPWWGERAASRGGRRFEIKFNLTQSANHIVLEHPAPSSKWCQKS